MDGPNDPLNLLLVDDDEIDRKAIRRAFSKLDIPINIVEASDGVEALAILQGAGDKDAPPPPFLILLDINMPQMDGIEFLQHLRSKVSDPKIRDAIVFILTTSEAEKDRERAYAQNIAGYLVKSGARGGLKGVADLLRTYRRVVALP